MWLQRLTTQTSLVLAVAAWLGGDSRILAGPMLYATTNADKWQVATAVDQDGDGKASSFPTSGFVTATAITNRPGWIANNDTGSNGGILHWTFFVFRQQFDLTGFDPATASLQFRWAADDSGQGFSFRGSWVPSFKLNGGAFVQGNWPNGESYSFGPTVNLTSGFTSGLNTIDFYVQGNGETDGFALEVASFTADPAVDVPEPATAILSVIGLAAFASIRFRRKTTSS